jgi:hypothetical protein
MECWRVARKPRDERARVGKKPEDGWGRVGERMRLGDLEGR